MGFMLEQERQVSASREPSFRINPEVRDGLMAGPKPAPPLPKKEPLTLP